MPIAVPSNLSFRTSCNVCGGAGRAHFQAPSAATCAQRAHGARRRADLWNAIGVNVNHVSIVLTPEEVSCAMTAAAARAVAPLRLTGNTMGYRLPGALETPISSNQTLPSLPKVCRVAPARIANASLGGM